MERVKRSAEMGNSVMLKKTGVTERANAMTAQTKMNRFVEVRVKH